MVSWDEPVENAWIRSRGRCEGLRGSRHQGQRCARDLVWAHRGRASLLGAWEAQRKDSEGTTGWQAAIQIEILCWECYQRRSRVAPLIQAREADRSAPVSSWRHSHAKPAGSQAGSTVSPNALEST
jgi:hypothetical protein